ncbi:MAG: EamA family transporter [Bacteroidota bacterium]
MPAPKNLRLLVLIGFVVVSTVWGSTWLAIKMGLEYLPPFLSAGARFVVASLLLFVIIRIRGLRITFTPEALKTYFAIGVLSFSLPFALVYWGEQFIPSSLGSILFGAFPFTVALCSHFFSDDEKLDKFKMTGTIIGFVGIVVIFAPGLSWTGNEGMMGMAAVLVSMVLQAYALVPIKKHGKNISPFVMNFVGMTMSALFLLFLAAVFEREQRIVWNTVSISAVLYLAVVGSVIAFVTYYWLLKHLEAVYLSLSSFINPIIAVILGSMVLGEKLDTSVAVGAGFVLVGILATNGRAILVKFHL